MKKLIFASVCLAFIVATFTACWKNKSRDNLNNQNNHQQASTEKMNESSTQNDDGFTGTENGHDWVDLGFDTKWATCNVGATKPEEYGNYYAWGEITTKEIYTWNTYKYCTYNWILDYKSKIYGDHYASSYIELIKYCVRSRDGKDGFTDTLITLEATDDAATANWGEPWRMPTQAEWNQLYNRDNCIWIWTSNYNRTGVAGSIVISRSNGNRIFLPAAGFCYGDSPLYRGEWGHYWSISCCSQPLSHYAKNMSFNSRDTDLDDAIKTERMRYCSSSERFYGYSVRPVLGR